MLASQLAHLTAMTASECPLSSWVLAPVLMSISLTWLIEVPSATSWAPIHEEKFGLSLGLKNDSVTCLNHQFFPNQYQARYQATFQAKTRANFRPCESDP